MKLEGCRGLETRRHEDTEGLDKIGTASTIIISTWCAPARGAVEVDAVHVGSENRDWPTGLSGDLGDDRALDEGVGEEGDSDSAAGILSGDLERSCELASNLTDEMVVITFWRVSRIQTDAAWPVLDL